MKNALILHGTDANSQHNWFPWLKKELEDEGWRVWVPDLPGAEKPNITRYNTYLMAQKDFELTPDTVIIGHSSGAVAALGLLQAMPEDVVIKRAILVGAFDKDLGWESLKEIADYPLDHEKIKKHVKEITFVHADNDPFIALEQPERMAKKLGAELIVLEGQGHFSESTNPFYKKFPYLKELVLQTEE